MPQNIAGQPPERRSLRRRGSEGPDQLGVADHVTNLGRQSGMCILGSALARLGTMHGKPDGGAEYQRQQPQHGP